MTSPAAVTTLITEFWVIGTPKPQGSKRAFQHPSTKRIVLTEAAGAPLKDWRYEVKTTAGVQMAGRPMIVQPAAIMLVVDFVLPRPTSLPKTKATPAAVKKPDTDKLLRAVCDSLTGVVYADDSQVIDIRGRKRTAELGEQPGAKIAVYTVG
jgi:crossover junction endodeoxyribonuclease RusA